MAIDFVVNMMADAIGFLSTHCIQTSTVKVATGGTAFFQVRKPPHPDLVRYRTGSKFAGMGNSKATGVHLEARLWDAWSAENADSERVEGVWSGYGIGLPTHCTLPNAGGPDIMFTPRLDGCSLTWGALGGGTVFGHYNLLTDDKTGTVARADMKQAGTDHFGDQPFGIISKETYFNQAKRNDPTTGDKRTTANAFGVRHGTAWHFYIQYIETKPAGLQIRGVEELTAGTKYNAALY
jgi:hypothetical protein